MSDVSGLQLRGKTYFARKRVPDDLRPILGKWELTKTLETSDKREAKRRLWPVLSAWETMFAELRNGTARPQLVDLAKHPLTPEAVDHASWWHYNAALERDTIARRQRPTREDVQATLERVSQEAEAAGIDPKDPLALLSATVDYLVVRDHKQLTADTRAVYLKELRKHLDEGETVLIDHEVQAYIAENNLDVSPGSQEWRELAHRMMRAEIEALQRARERDAGDYAGQPQDPIVRPSPPPHRPTTPPADTIPAILDQFAADNS